MTSASRRIAQVLRGLALNREPGWNFPGNFLELSFDHVALDEAVVDLGAGPHCESDGEVPLAAVCVLADIAMAAALRTRLGFAQRLATVQISLSFTGAPMRGSLRATSSTQLSVAQAAATQYLAMTVIRGEGDARCVGTASFVALGNAQQLAPMPILRPRGGPAVSLGVEDLDGEEAKVLADAREADSGLPGFLHRFWGLQPAAGPAGAECEFRTGLHVGNRVGHTQGGISLALAAETARAAAPPGWALTSVAGWYLAAGRGAILKAAAKPLHTGASTACTACETTDEKGRQVMQAIATHARLAANPPASPQQAD